MDKLVKTIIEYKLKNRYVITPAHAFFLSEIFFRQKKFVFLPFSKIYYFDVFPNEDVIA